MARVPEALGGFYFFVRGLGGEGGGVVGHFVVKKGGGRQLDRWCWTSWTVRVWAEMFSDGGGGAMSDSFFFSFFLYFTLLTRTQARLSVLFYFFFHASLRRNMTMRVPFSSYPIWDFGS